nr:uncharacterized protein LOC122320952 [Drosophila bipectinata]
MNFVLFFSVFVSIIQGYLFYISTPKYDIPATWNRNYGAEDVVREINAKRAYVEFPQLVFSASLSEECKIYADLLSDMNIPAQRNYFVEAKRNYMCDQMGYKLNDNLNTTITENICEYDFPKHFFVEYWYTFGRKAYMCPVKEKNPEIKSLADKYTAMMWKSSQYIGVAIVPKNKAEKYTKRLVVVRFHPPGNQYGEFEQNVPLATHGNWATKANRHFIIELILICFWTAVIFNVPLYV